MVVLRIPFSQIDSRRVFALEAPTPNDRNTEALMETTEVKEMLVDERAECLITVRKATIRSFETTFPVAISAPDALRRAATPTTLIPYLKFCELQPSFQAQRRFIHCGQHDLAREDGSGRILINQVFHASSPAPNFSHNPKNILRFGMHQVDIIYATCSMLNPRIDDDCFRNGYVGRRHQPVGED